MISIGLVGSDGRAGTLRKCIHAFEPDVYLKGYFNYGIPDPNCKDKYQHFKTYEEMLADLEINTIFISNFYCSHAKMAIQALRAGKHVLSEITAAVTPKECVELVEAVEKSGKVYALLENFSLLPVCYNMQEELNTGKFGYITYAEGEYCHPLLDNRARALQKRSPNHWRAYRPCTFYADHALAPLIHMLSVTPTSVVAKAAPGTKEYAEARGFQFTELAGPMLVSTKEGPILKISGCTHYAGHGRYYRVVGDKGGIETVRGNGYALRTWYNGWTRPDKTSDASNLFTDVKYPEKILQKYSCTDLSHEGSDLLVLENFFAAINGITKPYFDVYKAVDISAVQIYGWRSVLNGSNNIQIPDFKSKAERDKVRYDDLTPFWVDDIPPTLPCTISTEKEINYVNK